MASITGSATATLVAMLSTVNTTANTATRAVHTVASTLDMLDQYVQDARAEQIARSELSRETMLTRIHEDASIENALRQDNLQSQLKTNASLATLFAENHTALAPTMEIIRQKLAALDSRGAISA